MERFTNNAIIFTMFIVFSMGCKPDIEDTIAPHSDLYTSSNPFTGEVSYTNDKPIKYLNIHCTASKGELSKEWLLNFFKNERGWSKPGYNLVVHKDGTVDTLVTYNLDGLVSYNEISYGVRGKNSESINMAYTGGVDNRLQPKDTRTPAQKARIAQVVTKIKCQFPDIEVLGHRDHPNVHKACPSFSVKKEFGGYDSQEDMDLFNTTKDSYLFDDSLDSLEYN